MEEDDDMEVIEEIHATDKESETALDLWGPTDCIFCKAKLIDVEQEPKLLCCLHAACLHCVKENTSNDSVTCAGCSQQCQLNEVIDHQFVIELKQDASNNSSETKDKAPTCSCGDNAEAESYCDDCQEWLCDECVGAHQRVRFTRDHIIKKKEEVQKKDKEGSTSNQMRYLQCPIHKQELLKLYCESCEKLTCRDCQLMEHKEHKYQFLSSVSEQYKSFLTTLLGKIREKSSYIENAQQLVEKRQADIVEREEEVMKEIKVFAVQIITLINQRGKQLLQELHETCEKKKEQLTSKNDELINLSLKLDHCLKFADSAVKESSDSALVYSKKIITNQLKHVLHKRCEVPNPQHIVDIRFAYDSKYLPEYINKVGQIMVDQPAANNVRVSNNRPNVPNQVATNNAGRATFPFSQQNVPNQQSPQKRPSPPVVNSNYTPRSQTPQNNHVANNVRAVPAQGFQQPNRTYPPRNQNMDPKMRQPVTYPGQRPRPLVNPRQQSPQNVTIQRQPANNTYQGRNNANSSQVAPGTPKVISVTSMSPNQGGHNPNISLSMNNTQRLSHYSGGNSSQLPGHSNARAQQNPQIRSANPTNFPRPPNSSAGNQGVQVKLVELGRNNRNLDLGRQNGNPKLNNRVPKSCSLTPVPNTNKGDDDDDIKIIEEKRTGLPDGNSKAAEAAREIHAYMEQSIGNINEITSPSKKKEIKKDSIPASTNTTSLPVISNVVTLVNSNPFKSSSETSSSKCTKDSEPNKETSNDSRSVSGDSGIGDVKQNQDLDGNDEWCAVCHDGGELFCCSNCPRVFHDQCHIPDVSSNQGDDWKCNLCAKVEAPTTSETNAMKICLGAHEIRVCERILLETLCFEYSVAFHEPVSEAITEYHEIIKNPMDLATIKKKLFDEKYKNAEDFFDDLNLVFKNCYYFNSQETEFYENGKKTEEFVKNLIVKFLPEIKYQLASCSKSPSTSPRSSSPVLSSSSSDEVSKPKKRKNWTEDSIEIRSKREKSKVD